MIPDGFGRSSQNPSNATVPQGDCFCQYIVLIVNKSYNMLYLCIAYARQHIQEPKREKVRLYAP